MLKNISITLPENMIQEIDEMLLLNNFVSRSDFFRHLVRMWQQKAKQKSSGVGSEKSIDEASEELDLEYGIPMHIIKELEEKAKLLS